MAALGSGVSDPGNHSLTPQAASRVICMAAASDMRLCSASFLARTATWAVRCFLNAIRPLNTDPVRTAAHGSKTCWPRASADLNDGHA